MQIGEPAEFEHLIKNAAAGDLIMFSERDGTDFSAVPAGKKLTALIGPKGGWDDSELEKARSLGTHVITLGGRILRAETAAIALTSLLQHRFGDLN